MKKSDKNSSSTQHTNGEFLEKVKYKLDHLFSKNPSSFPATNTVQLPKQTLTNSISHTRATFMAFVDAVIPSSFGALDLRLDDYLIWALDHYVTIQGEWGLKDIPLSSATAEILDAAARQLILSGNVIEPINDLIFPDGGPFAALSVDDRFEAIHLLENSQVDMESLPTPYRNNIGLVKSILTNIHQIVMIGYYSEWFANGATRLAPPENRRIERPYLTWELVNYPGPALGYRDLRGLLVKEFND